MNGRIEKSLLILFEAIEASENALVRSGDYKTLIELGKFHLVVMEFYDDAETAISQGLNALNGKECDAE